MASSRAYIPSVAVLRALSRPLPPQCPFARHLPLESRRGIRKDRAQIPNLLRKLAKTHGVEADETIAQQDGKSFSKIKFYEMDLDAKTPVRRLVNRIETPDQYQDFVKKTDMALERFSNPEYDDTELKKATIEDMMQDPNFAHLRDTLEVMKQSQGTDEEAEVLPQEVESEIVMNLHGWAQETLQKPEYAAAREEIREFQSKLPHWPHEDSGFQDAVDKLEKKLRTIPAAWKEFNQINEPEQDDDELSDEWLDKFERDEVDIDDLLKEEGLDEASYSADHIDALLIKMKELMAAMGGNKEIEDEIQTLLDNNPANAKEEEEDDDRAIQVFDMKKLTRNIKMLQETPEELSRPLEGADKKAQEMVDQLLADPDLLPKLTALKKRIEASKLRTVKAPSAPDPETLDPSRLTSYRERLAAIKNDPEHISALRRLEIHLLPPFNVSPALRALNEALKLAYLGASDDVRRVLWRSYMKARTVPTLLQNIPDDAWDMLWYSQAVTWNSNQNREKHMSILLHDLNSIGRDGPPTHPESLEHE